MDIVERLRLRNVPYGWTELADKAADEIERLRLEIYLWRNRPQTTTEYNGVVLFDSDGEQSR